MVSMTIRDLTEKQIWAAMTVCLLFWPFCKYILPHIACFLGNLLFVSPMETIFSHTFDYHWIRARISALQSEIDELKNVKQVNQRKAK